MAGASVNMPGFVKQIYRKNKQYRGVIFLDRDGTINKEVNYLSDPSQLEILPTGIQGIRLLNKKNIAAVVITNQPAVARGLISITHLKKINDSLVRLFRQEKVYVDAIYSCPHHPEKDFPDIPAHAMKFRIRCDCRKPGLAMYKQALADLNVSEVFGVIGDQSRDIMAGKKLNIPTALVSTGYAGGEGSHTNKPDYFCNNFLEAIIMLTS